MQLIKFFIWIFIDNSLIKYFLSFIIYLIIIQSLFLLLALIFFDLKFNFSPIIAKNKYLKWNWTTNNFYMILFG